MKDNDRLLVAALISLVTCLACPASAATRTWNGSASGYWTNGANWTGGFAPANGDTLVFPSSAAQFVMTNTPGASSNFTFLDFSGSGYSLHSGILSVTNGLTNGPSPGVNTFHALVVTRANQTWMLQLRTVLSLQSNLSLASFDLTLNGPGAMHVSNNVTGAAGSSVVQIGTGTVILNGTASSVPDWRVGNGELTVNGILSGNLSISNGAVLSGTGSVPPFGCAGTVRPGTTGAGVLTITPGTATFHSGSFVQLILEGTTPGTGYSQLSVASPPDLSGATLSVFVSGFIPVAGDTFVIINNTGGAAFSTQFNGQPEGSAIMAGGTRFVISYAGGDGNDVTLRVVPDALFNGNLDLCHAVEVVSGFFRPKPLGWATVGSRSVSGSYKDELSSEPWAGPAPTPVTTDGNANPPHPEGCSGSDCAVFFHPFSGSAADGAATGHLYQDVAATAGLTYALIGWAGAEPNALMGGAEFALDFFDASNNLLGSSTLDLIAAGLFADNGQPFDYKQFIVAATAPPNATIVRVRASMIDAMANPMGGGQAFVVDDFSLITVIEPFITLPPQSRTNLVGTTATFTVTALSGTPMTYRWLKDGAPLFDGGHVSGATTPVLTLSSVLLVDAAQYSVVVSNSMGDVTSTPATLTVIPVPTDNLLLNPHLDFCEAVEIVPGFFLPKPSSWENAGIRSITGPYEDEMSSEPWAGPMPTPVTTNGNANPPHPQGCGGPDCGVFFRPFSGNMANGAATGHLYQDNPAIPGFTYTMSGWAGAEANALMSRAEFALEFFDGSNNMIASEVLDLSTNGLFVPNGQPFNYKQYTVIATAPPDAVVVRVRASMIDAVANPNGGGQAFVVDDFSLTADVVARPRITSITILPPDATRRITAQGEPFHAYTLQGAGSLAAPVSWSNLGVTNANALGDFEYMDAGALDERFYRLFAE